MSQMNLNESNSGRWVCDYCGRRYDDRLECIEHEAMCGKNEKAITQEDN